MAYVHLGGLIIFIIFTCNLNWVKIKKSLFAGQKTNDRLDITARLFHGRLNKLMSLLKDKHIYSQPDAQYIYCEMAEAGPKKISYVCISIKSNVRSCPTRKSIRIFPALLLLI